MCLAEFAANYTTHSNQEHPEDETSDVLPIPEDRESGRCESVTLKNNLGHMYKRKKEAIIRFHRFNLEKEPDKVYRFKIMLYVPWRDESSNLLGGYMAFRSHYEDKLDGILTNERKYTQNATEIDGATPACMGPSSLHCMGFWMQKGNTPFSPSSSPRLDVRLVSAGAGSYCTVTSCSVTRATESSTAGVSCIHACSVTKSTIQCRIIITIVRSPSMIIVIVPYMCFVCN